MYEFQELGVTEGIQTTWKLMGADLNGRYGGQNGTGGFEGFSPYLNLFYPTIADFHGNILGFVTNGVVSWNNSRVTAYGAVPAYRPATLGSSATLDYKYAYRNRATESIGLVWLGANWYDPIAGRFMSPDPAGHDVNPSLYSFCGGDPVNGFDADGRCVEAGANYLYNGGVAGQVLRGVGSYLDSYNNNSAGGGYLTGAVGTIVDELAGINAPSTYVNGLASYGNNVSTVYNDSGILAAGSYAATSWNVGAVWSGTANINLATGEPVGDAYQRWTAVSSGVASTAGVASGGVSLFNWATAPAATAPAAASADTVTPGMEISTYRQTTAGESFYHYGYSEQASGFQNGLRPGGYATSIGDLSGSEAQSGLALPSRTTLPNSVYTVNPNSGTWIRANPVAEPLFGQPGGLPEYQFPAGTAPGTVLTPATIPLR
jgi:RHS repeat-associated protein